MSAHLHTPGPWWADSSRYGTIYVEANAVIDKRLVQEICAVGPTESGRNQQEANARLIAAAPQMLAVLEELSESASYWSESDVPLGIVERINAAIAAARWGAA